MKTQTFIVKEQRMNGTVTAAFNVYGLRADSFSAARCELRQIIEGHGGTIITDTDKVVTYYFKGQFPTMGEMEDEQLVILGDHPPATPDA